MTRPTTAAEYRRRLAALGSTRNDPELTKRAARAFAASLADWEAKMRAAVIGPLAAAAQQLDTVMRPIISAVAPGAFFGDLVRVREFKGSRDSEAAEAAARLISNYFRRSQIIHPNRWEAGLRQAFARRRYESGKSSKELWADLATAPLVIATRQLDAAVADPETGAGRIVTVQDAYNWLRARIRNGVEVDLLGRTQDAKSEVLYDDASLPVSQDPLEAAEQRADLLLALSRFPLDDVRLLFEYDGLETPAEYLASRYSTTPAAIRQRVSRFRRQLKAALGTASLAVPRQEPECKNATAVVTANSTPETIASKPRRPVG